MDLRTDISPHVWAITDGPLTFFSGHKTRLQKLQFLHRSSNLTIILVGI
jgi:hypothetical protein